MTGQEFDRACARVLGDNYISWKNGIGLSPDVVVRVKSLPNVYQRDELRSLMPVGISINWLIQEPDYPITIDTN